MNGVSAASMDKDSWPRISIVTPSFNSARFIESTIQSVLAQGYPNYEYIIIDGGSTDGTQEIIRRYEQQLAYWVSESDKGMYDAINKGFARASGDVMAWINADDMHLPWTMQTVGQIMRELDDIEWLTTGHYLWINSRNEVFQTKPIPQHCRTWHEQGRELWQRNFIMQEGTFWRRSLWVRSGAYLRTDLDLAGDYELWNRFWQHAELVTVSAPLAAFRFSAKQKTAGDGVAGYLAEAERIRAESSHTTDRWFRFGRRLARCTWPWFHLGYRYTETIKHVSYDLSSTRWRTDEMRIVP